MIDLLPKCIETHCDIIINLLQMSGKSVSFSLYQNYVSNSLSNSSRTNFDSCSSSCLCLVLKSRELVLKNKHTQHKNYSIQQCTQNKSGQGHMTVHHSLMVFKCTGGVFSLFKFPVGPAEAREFCWGNKPSALPSASPTF